MASRQEFETLYPTQRAQVFDVVSDAGFDVSDWTLSSKNPLRYRMNPKYCYNWSFIEPGKAILLNLWHAEMQLEDARIIHRHNFRSDSERNSGPGGNSTWARRARHIDEALQAAVRDNLAVRVAVLAGHRRKTGDPNATASKVEFRELDDEPWTVLSYDWNSGQCTLARGIAETEIVDQFTLDQERKLLPERVNRASSVFKRNPEVRRKALLRSNGCCELCGLPGFLMSNGKLYLETHHIIPLFEGGDDTLSNVVALCPNHHREAHHGNDSRRLRQTLYDIMLPKIPS